MKTDEAKQALSHINFQLGLLHALAIHYNLHCAEGIGQAKGGAASECEDAGQ